MPPRVNAVAATVVALIARCEREANSVPVSPRAMKAPDTGDKSTASTAHRAAAARRWLRTAMMAATDTAEPIANGIRPLHRLEPAVTVATQVAASGWLVSRTRIQHNGVIDTVAIAPTSPTPSNADRYGVNTE
jgi:hypothetical protein